MNISSIVVKTRPDVMEGTLKALEDSGLCTVYFHDPTGRIVVTVEGEDATEEMEKMKALMSLPGVISADLAYTYCEDELIEGISRIAGKGAVPESLES
ncbi:MAG: chaperone NapD [Thermodesulfovibrionales bacterium]